jgi:hypothetical protein
MGKDLNEQPDEDSESYGTLSKINSAALINLTITNLWNDFFRHFREGKYLSSNNDLDCLWMILGGEKGIKDSDTEKEYLKIETSLCKSGTLQDSVSIKGFNKVEQTQLDKFSKQKGLLKDKGLFLRRIQNSQGMGKAYNDASSDYMD